MSELWDEFCYLIGKHASHFSSEREFQVEAENMFEKLGWSRFRGEIVSQVAIPIGSAHSLRPDIILRHDSKDVIVVELKKPSAGICDRNATQLVSYMLQMKLRFGLLIGDGVQLYYDKSDDDELPCVVLNLQLQPGSEQGEDLLRQLSKQAFVAEDFGAYCELLYESLRDEQSAEDLTSWLVSADGKEYITKTVCDDLAVKHGQHIADTAIKRLNISASRRQAACVTLPQTWHSTAVDESDMLTQEALFVSGVKNQVNGSPYISEPVVIGEKTIETCKRNGELFQEFVRRTLRILLNSNMIPQEELARLQTKEYSKKMLGLEFPLLETNTTKLCDRAGHRRYWANPISGKYYATNDWWKQKMYIYEPKFAAWLKHIAELNV
ncbi:MAG: hypothetical protein LBG97_04085 [Coriobacteriales bacterium]|nr:hypothetical protein [Coriobacteriales bacterium]